MLRNFNSIRRFNASRAACVERMDLLDCLKEVGEDWMPTLSDAMDAMHQEWKKRTMTASEMIYLLLESTLTISISEKAVIGAPGQSEEDKEENQRLVIESLKLKFTEKIEKIEQAVYGAIQDLYHHTIFKDILQFPLISNDVLAGHAAPGPHESRNFFSQKSSSIKIGPVKDIRFMFMLIDRAFLFHLAIVNWPHGNRACLDMNIENMPGNPRKYLIENWNGEKKKICSEFLNRHLLSIAQKLYNAFN